MASQKSNNLLPYITIPKTLVSSGSVISAATDMFTKDNIAYQFSWDGTLAGTFDLQVSVDYNPLTLIGTWTSVPQGSTTAAALGTPDNGTIVYRCLEPRFSRIVFTWTAGSGNLMGNVMGKAV